MFEFVQIGQKCMYIHTYMLSVSCDTCVLCVQAPLTGGYASAPCSKGTGQHTHGADAREDGGVDGNAVDDRTRRKDSEKK